MGRAEWIALEPALRRDTEQFGDEERLTDGIAFGQPSHSSFPNHMNCFDALQRPSRTFKRAVAFGEPSALLYGSVILLDHVV